MEWSDFIVRNENSILLLVGVLIGGLLGAITGLLTQRLQHKWNLQNQRREWRRSRREQQLDTLVAFLNQWLLAAARIRTLEDVFEETGVIDRRPTKDEIRRLDKSLHEVSAELGDQSAIVEPVVRSLGDDVLLDLYGQFRALTIQYQDVFQADDFTAATDSNAALVSEAKKLVARVQDRAFHFIDEVFS